jgi:hypothetical protein
VSDIDTVVVDSLKALDPEWPIREADIQRQATNASEDYEEFIGAKKHLVLSSLPQTG